MAVLLLLSDPASDIGSSSVLASMGRSLVATLAAAASPAMGRIGAAASLPVFLPILLFVIFLLPVTTASLSLYLPITT